MGFVDANNLLARYGKALFTGGLIFIALGMAAHLAALSVIGVVAIIATVVMLVVTRGSQRANSEARQILKDLYMRRVDSHLRLSDWEQACSMIRNIDIQDAAANGDSSTVALWIKYHEVPEPQPVLEDFLPENVPAYDESASVLSEAERRFEADWYAHPQREKERLEFVEVLKTEYERLRTKERAENLKRQLEKWPQGVILDPDVAEIEGIERQVEAQNTKTERQVDALTDLLAEGLDALPPLLDGTSSERIDRATLDPHAIAERIETALTTMHLPIDVRPKLRAAYTPDSHQAVVEYELPRCEDRAESEIFPVRQESGPDRRDGTASVAGQVTICRCHRAIGPALSC